MATFAYNPTAFSSWANSVVDYLSGGGESVDALSKKLKDQIDVLVQPNIWTGPAAKKNFNDFRKAHEALVTFVNKFGIAFEETMQSVSKNIGALEQANAGGQSNTIASSYTGTDFSSLQTMSEATINIEEVVYDYPRIMEIGSQLTNISNSLETINSNLIKKINELDSGVKIWDGNAAGSARDLLTRTLSENILAVKEALNICSANITEAGEAASQADRA